MEFSGRDENGWTWQAQVNLVKWSRVRISTASIVQCITVCLQISTGKCFCNYRHFVVDKNIFVMHIWTMLSIDNVWQCWRAFRVLYLIENN